VDIRHRPRGEWEISRIAARVWYQGATGWFVDPVMAIRGLSAARADGHDSRHLVFGGEEARTSGRRIVASLRGEIPPGPTVDEPTPQIEVRPWLAK
jgi:hypothetical protein